MTQISKILILLLLSAQLFAQKTISLPRSTPEAEGVSSEGIINFLDAVSKSNYELHSFMVLRHGKVVAEGWWNPYRPDLKHTMYSVSKTFTATAIGLAVSEKRINVEDKVISFFPDDLPEEISPNLSELRIKHLLSMSVGHKTDPTYEVRKSDHWIKTFFKTPIVDVPGSKFLYNSVATYMLSAIVQKVTGEKVIDYLKPRLFDPLGIHGIDWETDPLDINVGGWGLRLKTEDMAKLGQLFLQHGSWEGKQILPVSWIDEASTMKILQDPTAPQARRDSSDWHQGYGYQMWRSRNNSYRADGAYGQFIIVLPDQDAVIAITAEASNMQSEFNTVWKYLLPAFKRKKLSRDSKMLKRLNSKIASLAVPLPVASNNMELEKKISGKTFGVITNDQRLRMLSFAFQNGICNLTLTTDSATHLINFGSGKWLSGETSKFGPYLTSFARNNRVGLPPFKIAGSYTWKNESELELTLRYIESPHTEIIRCTFEDEYVTIEFVKSFNKSVKSIIYKGVLRKDVSRPPRLVIRGDDMGFSHSANEAMIKCYKEGIETSIEVIVPSPWFPEAVKLLQQNKRIDVGLHFAITSEWDNIKWRPLTDCPSIRNEDGYFYQMLFTNKNYPRQAVMDNGWKLEDVEKELRAQIEMALKYIPRLSHVSGHMASTSFTPEIKTLATRIAKEYNLPMVDGDPEKSISASYIRIDFKNKTTEERVDAFIKMLDLLAEDKTYVFVEHPGIDNEELRAISHIGYEDVAEGRQDVTTLFTNEKVKEAIHRKGIDLVSYKEVFSNQK